MAVVINGTDVCTSANISNAESICLIVAEQGWMYAESEDSFEKVVL